MHELSLDKSKMNNPIKIAICGKKNVGKNTLSQILQQEIKLHYNTIHYNNDTDYFIHHIMAFADPIKEMILLMFPFAKRECLFGSSELREELIPNAINQEGHPLTYRQALIDIGTLGRKYNPNIWVNAFDERIKCISSTNLIICSDLRFIEELEYLKKNHYIIIKLLRNSVTQLLNATETVQDGIPNDQFNFIIENNGTIDALQCQTHQIVQKI